MSKLKTITRKTFEHYINLGIFDSLHPNKRQLFEFINEIMSFKDNGEQSFLFDTEEPKLPDIPEWNITNKLQH